MKLPEKILYCRKRAGLSQEELAGRLGVSRQAVSKWETGEAQPELSKLAPLAAELGVSVDWLLSDAEPEEPRAEPERAEEDRKSTRQNSSHIRRSRMPSSA